MKTFIVLLVCLLAGSAKSANDTIHPKSRVSKVTVFFNGAQVTRSMNLKLTKGGHLILIEDLPQEINAQSIQVSATQGAKLLSVKHLRDQSNAYAPAREKDINDKIKAQERKIMALQNKQNVFEMEERILLDNSLLAKKDEGTTVARIKEAGDFYRARLNEIKQGKLDLTVELEAAEEKIKELYVEMNQVVSKKRKPGSRIMISLECDREVDAPLNLSYYTSSAGWEPTYDFRLEDINKPFQVVYNANVFQSSGEDWVNAKIRLSTADPSLSANKPELDTWILGQVQQYRSPQTRVKNGSIEGTVADGRNQQFIANANVVLMSGNKMVASAISNQNGRFTLKPVAAGNYAIIISYVGFYSINQGIQVNAGFATTQGFYLQANAIAMHEDPLPSFQQAKYIAYEIPIIDPDTKSGMTVTREDYQNLATKDINTVASRRRYKKQKQETVQVSPEVFESAELFASSLDEKMSNIEYIIDLPYTIPSDGQDYALNVKEVNLPARFVYHVVPKIESDVFLVAEISNWQKLKLLSGKASVYFEGTFTGESYINADMPGDTLEISIGRDNDIVVKREGNKMLNDKKSLGNYMKETVGWELTIKNNKRTNIHLILEDQIPVSQRKTVEVELIESGGAKIEEDTGKLTWEMDLEGGAKKVITTKFSVKYPKQSGLNTD